MYNVRHRYIGSYVNFLSRQAHVMDSAKNRQNNNRTPYKELVVIITDLKVSTTIPTSLTEPPHLTNLNIIADCNNGSLRKL